MHDDAADFYSGTGLSPLRTHGKVMLSICTFGKVMLYSPHLGRNASCEKSRTCRPARGEIMV